MDGRDGNTADGVAPGGEGACARALRSRTDAGVEILAVVPELSSTESCVRAKVVAGHAGLGRRTPSASFDLAARGAVGDASADARGVHRASVDRRQENRIVAWLLGSRRMVVGTGLRGIGRPQPTGPTVGHAVSEPAEPRFDNDRGFCGVGGCTGRPKGGRGGPATYEVHRAAPRIALCGDEHAALVDAIGASTAVRILKQHPL